MSGPSSAAVDPLDRPAIIVANRKLMIAAVMAAMIMTMIDATIANVALPYMQPSLGATQETISWVLTSYVLASAVALPLSGWLVDRQGIRPVLVVSVLTFTLASVLCGLAQNMGEIVAFRIAQGVAGAFISPLCLTLLMNTSSPREQPRMMTLYMLGIMIGPIVGPVLGGYLTENLNWRWVFFVNVPIGAICVFMLLALVPHTGTRERSFDRIGWLFVATAMAAMQLLLDRGPLKDWFASAEIVVWAVLCGSTLWMAIVHLMTTDHPIFPTGLFKDRNFVAGLSLFFVINMVMMSVLALLPSLLQSIFGYPAVTTGWLMTSRGVGMTVSIIAFGKLMERGDPRLLTAIGLATTGLSFWWMTGWSPQTSTIQIVSAGALQGLGFSFAFIPLNLIAFTTLGPHLRTDASSLLNMVRNMGSSVGIAVATVMLSRNIQLNHAEMGAMVTRLSVPFDLDRVTAYGTAGGAALNMVDMEVNRQAVMVAYLDDFLMMAIACFAVLPVLFLLKRVRPGATVPGEAAAAH
jgi:DHA2 family multidrug resistance protein